MKKYKVIANPAAGRGKASFGLSRTVDLLKARGIRFDVEQTKGPNEAGRIARRASVDHDVIIAVGGDGTVNEIVQGMVFSSRPLGVVPAGSGNDFIKALGVPNNVEKAVDTIVRGNERTIDVGRINGRYFANAVGIGFDAAVNRASYSINHSKRGLVLYLCALLRTLGTYDPVPMTVTMNGSLAERPIFLLTAGNGTTVGGGFRLTPHALLDDRLLDVTIVTSIGVIPLLWHLPKVFRGTIERARKYAITGKTPGLKVECRRPVPVHVDGEMFGENEKRFEIEIVPASLRVIGNFRAD